MRALLSWCETEVTLGLSITGTSKEEHILASRGNLGELVEGEALTSTCEDSVAGLLGELKSHDPEGLGELQKSDIICDWGDNGDNFTFISASELGDAGQGDGISVESALVEPLVNDLVEATLSSAGQE